MSLTVSFSFDTIEEKQKFEKYAKTKGMKLSVLAKMAVYQYKAKYGCKEEKDALKAKEYDGHSQVKKTVQPKKPKIIYKLNEPGQIYIIECNGLYKIGRSVNAKKRIYSLQETTPFPIKTIAIFSVEKMSQTEHELHQLFKQKRKKGEWFNLAEDDLNELWKISGRERGSKLRIFYKNKEIPDNSQPERVGDNETEGTAIGTN